VYALLGLETCLDPYLSLSVQRTKNVNIFSTRFLHITIYHLFVTNKIIHVLDWYPLCPPICSDAASEHCSISALPHFFLACLFTCFFFFWQIWALWLLNIYVKIWKKFPSTKDAFELTPIFGFWKLHIAAKLWNKGEKIYKPEKRKRNDVFSEIKIKNRCGV
jgi:hypothetical protein